MKIAASGSALVKACMIHKKECPIWSKAPVCVVRDVELLTEARCVLQERWRWKDWSRIVWNPMDL